MMKMNAPCHAIAMTKQNPINLRLRSNHIDGGHGNKTGAADAATTKKMKGTAQRTENEIIAETPDGVDISIPAILIAMMMDIGMDMSQNNLQPLSALLFSTDLKSRLILC